MCHLLLYFFLKGAQKVENKGGEWRGRGRRKDGVGRDEFCEKLDNLVTLFK